jgi:tetratricopeptide (TPR) repeat protein
LQEHDRAWDWEAAERTARAELASSPDVYAWFNLGTALTHQQRFEEAAAAFDTALEIGLPSERMLWYQFEPFEAYNQSGQYERTLAVSEPLAALGIEEVQFYRGRALEGLGRLDEARDAYRHALELRPHYPDAETRLRAIGG